MNPHDPTDLRAQETSERERATRQRLELEAEKTDVKWLMSTKRGRSFMWRLLEQAGIFRSSFDANAMRMAFAEGNRNYGNRVLDMVNRSCPELYTVMVKELFDDSRRDGTGNNSN